MFLFSGLWEGENNIQEKSQKKRDSVIEHIMKDLIPLQKDIIIMERSMTKHPKNATFEDIIRVKLQLNESRVAESRAINYLAKLDKIILPIPTNTDDVIP